MRSLMLAVVAAGVAAAQVDPIELLEQKTIAKIRAVDESSAGVVGVSAIDLTTGRVLSWHSSLVAPAASTIKVPVMIEVFRQASEGRIKLDQQVALTPQDLIDASPQVALLLRRGPASFTVRELVQAMIESSDNTAANALIDLAGMREVNATLEEFGFKATRLRRRMLDGAAARRSDENTSTPAELARLAEYIYRGKFGDDNTTKTLVEVMKSVESALRRAVPASIGVASKTGELPGARCEAGIVYLPKRPFAAGIMSAFIDDDENPVPELAAILYEHFDKLARSNRFGNRLE